MGRKRLAVIGGGVGAVTAVYGLMRDPALRAEWDVTIHQLGWRMGGKGASGRDMAMGARIEEHGLHVWAGFYDNAFRLLDDCYKTLNREGLRATDAPLGTMDAAFKPLSHLFLAEHVDVGRGEAWRPWLIELPTNGTRPGSRTAVLTPFQTFLSLMSILRTFFEDGEFGRGIGLSLPETHRRRLADAHAPLHAHAHAMPDAPARHGAAETSLLADLIAGVQRAVAELQTPEAMADDATRRTLLLAELSLAFAHGMAASEAFTAGYDVLDQWEFSDWLRRNGASERALSSVLLRGCYDFVFGYPHGSGFSGDVGAGTAIRAMSRLMLGYSGAIFHKMQAGMGDTIFAPYYQALRHWGVDVRFFSAARRLRLDRTGTRLAAVEMVRQATPLGGTYDPLVEVKGLPCWPSEPIWDRLEDGAALKASGIDFESEAEPPAGEPFTLEAGRDFDEVILGASLGSLGYLTEDLAAASARWKRMLGAVKTVGTRAAQFWLREPQDALGWKPLVEACNPTVKMPEGPLRTVITGFAEPLDTWADMSHLLDREDWGPGGPASIAYFCSPSPDDETPERFKAEALRWIDGELTQLWTGAEAPGHAGFEEADLWKPEGDAGSAFDAQYWRVNLHGSERYVLSVTNSVYHRLAPDESGFEGLTLAGDWTRCGLNAGCVEAATMSGIAAAEAVSGKPMLNVGAEDVPVDGSLRERAMYAAPNVSSAPWPLSGFYARGEMTGWFLFYALPRAEAQALLPPGMHLAHSHLAGHGMHPVGLSFCRYHSVRGSFVPDFMAMRPYGEATFAIPFVRTETTGRAQFLYPRRLYVDDLAAIAAGKLFYAMDKVRAAIDMDDRSFVARTPKGETFVDAAFVQHEDPRPLAEHPAFGTIVDLLEMPFVTKSRFGDLHNAFDLELEHAWAAPAAGHVTVTDDQPGGFPHASLEVAPLRPDHPHGLPGAVRLWCSWSMTNPLDGARIRKAAEAQSWLRRLR